LNGQMHCHGGEIANANIEDAGLFFHYIPASQGLRTRTFQYDWVDPNLRSCFFVVSELRARLMRGPYIPREASAGGTLAWHCHPVAKCPGYVRTLLYPTTLQLRRRALGLFERHDPPWLSVLAMCYLFSYGAGRWCSLKDMTPVAKCSGSVLTLQLRRWALGILQIYDTCSEVFWLCANSSAAALGACASDPLADLRQVFLGVSMVLNFVRSWPSRTSLALPSASVFSTEGSPRRYSLKFFAVLFGRRFMRKCCRSVYIA